MLEIDGLHGEGGGQIIRTAVSLSMVLGTDIKVTNIRGNRSKPGLAAQHITSIKVAAKLCNGTTSDLHVGANTLVFKPGRMRSGQYPQFNFDIGTAGSITLVLQTCILPSLLATTDSLYTFKITGGTDVQWSPPFDYFRLIFLKHLKNVGGEVNTNLIRRGYYPKGGGEIILKVKSLDTRTKLMIEDRGKLQRIDGTINISSLPNQIAERILNSANHKLAEYNFSNVPVEIAISNSNTSFSPGTGIVLRSVHEHSILGASSLGKKGKVSEQVGDQAAVRLKEELACKGSVDVFASDQLIPYLGLLGGTITVRVLSEHAKTNLWLVEQFIDSKFKVEEFSDFIRISK